MALPTPTPCSSGSGRTSRLARAGCCPSSSRWSNCGTCGPAPGRRPPSPGTFGTDLMEAITGASPRVFRPKLMGRMVGVGYLVLAVSGFDLFYVLPKLLVRADAGATAANIKAQDEKRWHEQATAAAQWQL